MLTHKFREIYGCDVDSHGWVEVSRIKYKNITAKRAFGTYRSSPEGREFQKALWEGFDEREARVIAEHVKWYDMPEGSLWYNTKEIVKNKVVTLNWVHPSFAIGYLFWRSGSLAMPMAIELTYRR